MLSIFKPAPHKARLPAAEIDPTYRRLRWQIFLGIFFGYAAYYLVRSDKLPEYTTDVNQLYDVLYNKAGVNGLFTDFPDKAVKFLNKE